MADLIIFTLRFELLVALIQFGWGRTGRLAKSFSQFVEAVENIQLEYCGAGTPRKKHSEWVFDFFDILRESLGDDVDEKVKFVHYKMVRVFQLRESLTCTPNCSRCCCLLTRECK